jgi:hypothetical protein
MRHHHDFKNTDLIGPATYRPGSQPQAIALSLSVSHEDKLLIPRTKVAALIMLDLVAIAAISVFSALATQPF